jgi:hypothetical protein
MLILGGVFLAASLVTPPGGAPLAHAQVPTPAPSPVTLTPTTTPEPLEAVQIWEGIKTILTSYGIWAALALLLLWLLAQILPDLVKDGLYGVGRRITSMVRTATGQRSGIDAYFDALIADYGEDEPRAAPGPANTRECGIGTTSVVGIFPDGRAGCGAEDMAGNVWEWCATAYRDYPLLEDLAPETLDTQEIIVLRGGTYYDNRTNVHCGAHHGVIPDDHGVHHGLRVARLFSSK